MSTRTLSFIALLAAAVLAACGDGANEEPPPAANAEGGAVEPAPPALAIAPAAPRIAAAPDLPAPPLAAAEAPPAAAVAPGSPPAAPVTPVPDAGPAMGPLAAPPASPPAPAVPEAPPAAPVQIADIPPDPALRAAIAAGNAVAGETAAAACAICHSLGPGEAARVGPNLYDLVGAAVGARPGFDYSPALTALGGAGATWTVERLDAFLRDPAAAVPGTRMAFAGMADERVRADLIAYLRGLSPNPIALGGVAPAPAVPSPPAVYTAAQAEAGRAVYLSAGCGTCHSANLRGEVDMREGEIGAPPALVGPSFARRWFDRPAADLFGLLRTQKPNRAPGSLSDAAYAELMAFILSENGLPAGDVALPAEATALAMVRLR